MIDAKIKDDVISLLYEGKGTADIANTLNIEQRYVVASIRDIQNRFPGGFIEHKGYGDDTIGVSLHPKYMEEMIVFVQQGGFEAEYEKALNLAERDEHKNNLEIRELELAINAAQKSEWYAERSAKEARSSRIATWIAAIAAVVAAAAAVMTLFN